MPTALLSVYNKEGIDNFARQLVELGWEIVASAGTAKALQDKGIPVRDVAQLVGGGPILGHRVVTLSREIHAGLLATDSSDDAVELKRLGIPRIDLVCVELYPILEAIQSQNSTRESVIASTDIGGPALLRSAAKGRRIIVCTPKDRQLTIDWLGAERPQEEDFLTECAAKAEAIVSHYCAASARYHSGGRYEGIFGAAKQTCRYGENAWQTPASFLSCGASDPLGLDNFETIAGVDPSYNNLVDLDRMLQTTSHIAAAFDANYSSAPKIAVGAKHGNPCGAGVGDSPTQVIQKMVSGDKRAIFGGAVMVNFPLTGEEAETMLGHLMPAGQRRLLDLVVAPQFSGDALMLLRRKGDKCRILANPRLGTLGARSLDTASRFRYVRGGYLRQPNYDFVLDIQNDARLEKVGTATKKQEADLLLAWAVGSTSNSNTVTLVNDSCLIGNGVGQQDRVSACELAILRAQNAGHDARGAVAYSDSFFPFPDGPAALLDAGIGAVLASSGSVRDGEVKALCQDRGVALYLIPDAIGRGFFGH